MVKPALDSHNCRLLTQQQGRCRLCGEHLLTADQPLQLPQEWERWWLSIVRRAIAAEHLAHHRRDANGGNRTHIVHSSCYLRRLNPAARDQQARAALDGMGGWGLTHM